MESEPIPLNPGEVLIAPDQEKFWHGEGANENSEIHLSKMLNVCLRHYGKRGRGEFFVSRAFKNLDCSSYDKFILFCHKEGDEITLQLNINTDAGEKKSKKVTLGGSTPQSFTELSMDLDAAKIINAIQIKVVFVKSGLAGGALKINGLILRHSVEFSAYIKHWDRFSHLKWVGLLQPESYEPNYKLQYGLLFNDIHLDEYRNQYKTEFKKLADQYRNRPAPEAAISPQNDSRQCCRPYVLDRFRKILGPDIWQFEMESELQSMALIALITQDKKMMRLAARYILSVATCESWSDHSLQHATGESMYSTFTQSYTLSFLSLALDCVGDVLTKKGRDYILKNMMLKGVSPINHSLWARPSAFDNNQAMVFLDGKMPAMLIFNTAWPRVKPMLKNTKAQADECMNVLFKPDGSYMESFGYLTAVISHCQSVYGSYASMLNKPLQEVLPANLKKSGAFGEVVASTSKHPKRSLISIGQHPSWKMAPATCIAFLATAAPKSMWVNLYQQITPEEKEAEAISLWKGKGILSKKLCKFADKGKRIKPKNLVLLKQSGLVSSLREYQGKAVKLVVIGDSFGMGKKHHDVGSFVLEYAGDIFAMDMPVYSGLYDEAQYHNMLVPILKNGHLGNSIPFTKRHDDQKKRNAMRPKASGNHRSFSAKVMPEHSWHDAHFKRATRSIESRMPDHITIHDAYELGQDAIGAAFVWLTYLPVKKQNNRIVISGEYGGTAELIIPDKCLVEIDNFLPNSDILESMSLPKNHLCHRLIIKKMKASGHLDHIEIHIKLTFT